MYNVIEERGEELRTVNVEPFTTKGKAVAFAMANARAEVTMLAALRKAGVYTPRPARFIVEEV